MGAKIIKRVMQRALIAIKIFTFRSIAYLYIYANNKSSYNFTVETREMQNAKCKMQKAKCKMQN